MRAMTGSRRAGLLSTLAVFLLPALGVGTAAALDVGDTMFFTVPDLSEFPEAEESHQFTCVAVTDHAYWMVQDTCSISYDASEGTLIWGNWVNQAEIDSLTVNFEGGGGEYSVYDTVTQALVTPADTDGDPRIYILFASIPDKYEDSNAPKRTLLVYVDPRDLIPDGGLNQHDIIYHNVHSYYTAPAVSRPLRQFNTANGLGMLARLSNRPDEDPLNYRALGQVAIYDCFGIASTPPPGNLGLKKHLLEFEKAPYGDLSYWATGDYQLDYAQNLGQSFLWLMYLEQRAGEGTIQAIAQSDTTGMLAMARAVDPTVADSVAIVTNLVPLYNDWLVCNITNPLRSDYAGGIYTYDIFEGETYQFSHTNSTAPWSAAEFTSYPFGLWVSDPGTASAPVNPPQALPLSDWTALYAEFGAGYEGTPDILFNGQFNNGTGPGAIANSDWTILRIATDGSDIIDVTNVPLSDFANGSFTLTGGGTNYLAVTSHYADGTPNLLWALTQDVTPSVALLAAFQNVASPQYIHFYTTVADQASGYAEGYDWYGATFAATHLTSAGDPDTTSTLMMSAYGELIWGIDFAAWDAGNYDIEVAGFDSSGVPVSVTRELAVGFSSSSSMQLDITSAQLDLPGGSMAPGSMVMIAETDVLGLSVVSDQPVASCMPALQGILAGPVSVSEATGTLSFPAATREGAVFRFNGEGWDRLDSYWQGGRMCAAIGDGGIYAYGTAPGVTSPELPAAVTLSGNCPNPFGSETIINFSLPSAGRATLLVYDVAGRVVRTLADDQMSAASHALVWDGRDDSGNTVGAGVYFCRLQASGQSAVQKMIRVAE